MVWIFFGESWCHVVITQFQAVVQKHTSLKYMQSFFWVFFSQYIYVNHVICNLGKCTSSWLKHACSNHERTWRQPVGFTIASRPTRSRYDESLALSLLNLIWCAFCVDFGVIYFFTCRRGQAVAAAVVASCTWHRRRWEYIYGSLVGRASRWW